MTEFTPLLSTIGGLLIGIASTILLASHGRIAGISGILGGLLTPAQPLDRQWRIWFLAGLMVTGAVGAVLFPSAFEVGITRSTPVLVAAGLLVGIGTQLGSGCTSGHGVCGISRLSARSLAATVTFLAAGMLTVFLFRTLVTP